SPGQASFYSNRSAAQFNSFHLAASNTSGHASNSGFNGQHSLTVGNANLQSRFQNSSGLNSIYSTSVDRNRSNIGLSNGSSLKSGGGEGVSPPSGRTPPPSLLPPSPPPRLGWAPPPSYLPSSPP